MSFYGPTGDDTPDEPDDTTASDAPSSAYDDAARAAADLASPGPLTNHVTGETALGCLGMLCLIAMLALLGIGFGGLGLPFWLTALTPALAFGVAGLGIGLMTRVPNGPPPRSRDPRHPLTRTGMAPIVERPAQTPNWVSVVASATLALVAVVGYATFSFDPDRERGLFWGPVVMTVAGAALLVGGALVMQRVLPIPALRWVRMPIQGTPPREGSWLLGAGAVAMASGLFLAFNSGALWGYIVVGLIILTMAFAALVFSFLQRRPRRRRLRSGGYAYSTHRPDGLFHDLRRPTDPDDPPGDDN